ncbi:MAG: site-2 protease family protein [Saprospirales bacterium]|nr:site-2 protease family protein [Saprospirales bacterium]MBK8491039.1 site-2 protease family protein [Saprospirales bacterium]
MKWSLKIARLAGIDVFVHWTFLILLGWIIWSNLQSGQTLAESLMGVWFILALFACVVLHEFGHALMARRFGVGTKHITLLPIGGVASIEKIPEKPAEELWVALAGPAVNVLIAALIALGFWVSGKEGNWLELSQPIQGNNFLTGMLLVNITLVLFNMIPAFPMDGGRVLRALLAMKMGRAPATEWAARIGQLLAIAFVFLGALYNFWLIFIGLFIYLGASAEANYEATQSMLSGYRVRDVLMHQFTILHASNSIDYVVKLLLDGQEKEFLVEEDQQIAGSITRDDLIKGLQQFGKKEPLSHILNRQLLRLDLDMPLSDAYRKMTETNNKICPVYRGSDLVGVLNQENVMETIMVENALRDSARKV